MGFTECSEETIKNRKEESDNLKANFEETLKNLTDKKQEHEKNIETYTQDHFCKQQKIQQLKVGVLTAQSQLSQSESQLHKCT